MYERRRFKRISDYLPISYRIPPQAKAEGFLTRDISEGGVKFLMHTFVPKGTVLELQINLKKISYVFEIRAEVRWVCKDPTGERFEAGAEFINLPKDVKERLGAYINEVIAR